MFGQNFEPTLAKLSCYWVKFGAYFGKTFMLLGKIWSILWQNFHVIGQIIIVPNGHLLKPNLAVWSLCRKYDDHPIVGGQKKVKRLSAPT